MRIKKSLSILIGLFLVVVPILAQGTVDNAENSEMAEPVAYVNYVEGEALFGNFEKVELNVIVRQGDEINTTTGRVEILLKGNGVIRLDRNTRVIFATLTDRMIVLESWSGNIYVKKGEVEIGIKSPSRSLNLSQSEWYLTEPEKSFKKWNNTRDEELNPSDNQYLPEELNRYGNTLNRYGSWRQYDPYGYVWIPRVSYGWRPYYYGRWVHIPILGWVWISYEEFGWCTYHYGRWHWSLDFGWYWIPTRHWGPAWVNWYSWGDYYAWRPMGYGGYWDRHHARNDSNVLTVIHKNRLRSRDIRQRTPTTISISKDQLRIPMRTAPTTTNTNNRIFRNQRLQNRNSISQIQRSRISPARPQSFSPQRISPSRSFSRPMRTAPTTTNTNNRIFRNQRQQNRNSISQIQRSRISPARPQSFSPQRISPARSVSRPISRSPSRPTQPIQKQIRKK